MSRTQHDKESGNPDPTEHQPLSTASLFDEVAVCGKATAVVCIDTGDDDDGAAAESSADPSSNAALEGLTTTPDTIATLVAGAALLLPTLYEVSGALAAFSVTAMLLAVAWYASLALLRASLETGASGIPDAVCRVFGRPASVTAAVVLAIFAAGTGVAVAAHGIASVHLLLHAPSVVGVVEGVATVSILVVATNAAASAIASVIAPTSSPAKHRHPLAIAVGCVVDVFALCICPSCEVHAVAVTAIALGSAGMLVGLPALLQYRLARTSHEARVAVLIAASVTLAVGVSLCILPVPTRHPAATAIASLAWGTWLVVRRVHREFAPADQTVRT